MPSKAITKKPEVEELDLGQSLRETAPSFLQEDVPTVARGIGFVGLLFFVLGALAVIFDVAGSARIVGGGVGVVLGFAGVVGLLYHAGRETDAAIRRMYGVLGGGLGLLLAIGMAVYPAEVGTPVAPQTLMGARFLPWGLVGLILALGFMLTSVRGETEEGIRKAMVGVVGVIGAVLAVGSLVTGFISASFFLPLGLLLSIVGLAYLWAFIGMTGSESDAGRITASVLGVLGVTVLVVAVVYSLVTRFGWFGAQIQLGYLTSTGILLMLVGVLYSIGGLAIVSERPFFVLLRRELAGFFYSPLVYFILVGFGVMAWVRHLLFISRAEGQAILEPIVGAYFLDWLPVIAFIFTIPMLTMRLLSEEERTGTMEMLMTLPLGEAPVVLSKFAAVLIVFLLSWLPYGGYLIALQMMSPGFDYRPLICFGIGLTCCAANYLAMGLFLSGLTRSQLAAFVMTAMAMVIITATLWLRSFSQLGKTGQSVLLYISYIDLWDANLTGQLYLGTTIFQLGMAAVWLFATVKVLEARKWL